MTRSPGARRCRAFLFAATPMAKLEAAEVARLLVEFGQRVALRGDNRFRARAYARAAENLHTLTKSLAEVIAEDRLREIPGVGDAIAGIIARIRATSTHPGL